MLCVYGVMCRFSAYCVSNKMFMFSHTTKDTQHALVKKILSPNVVFAVYFEIAGKSRDAFTIGAILFLTHIYVEIVSRFVLDFHELI